MNISDVALLINVSRAITVIKVGFRLVKKAGKTEEERRAAKAFLRILYSTVVTVLTCVVVLGVTIGYVILTNGGHSAHRIGRVEGGMIRYVQETVKYILPEEIGLSETDITEGDKIYLYFDADDDLITGEPEEHKSRRLYTAIIAMAACIIVLVFITIIMQATYGKPWYQWFQKQK